MLNDAWPSTIWHLYDYYLRPAGGYFGAKKACELLHVQYSYDDHSIVVVNGHDKAFPQLRITATVYDLNSSKRFSNEAILDVPPDSSQKAFVLPPLQGLSSTYFLRLTLESPAGQLLSSNFYWLSTQPDVLDWEKSKWYYTPTRSYADFTALKNLPPVALNVSSRFERKGNDEEIARVRVENPGASLAFFVHLRISKGQGGEEVLPVLWEDNYVSLLPGETIELEARYRVKDLEGEKPVVEVDGWNVISGSEKPRAKSRGVKKQRATGLAPR